MAERRASGRRRGGAFVALAGLALVAPALALARDLTELPLETLLALEVRAASLYPQPLSEAPSAVSVVTAADIRAYGHRTLADVLRSVPGLYVTDDRNYSYLGVRGFARPGDYYTRVLLLIDGYRANDNVFDSALIGTEFLLDVDLIERVEFVPGPGSAIYGNNAFFGVVNVVTRRPRDLDGAELSGEAGSFGTRKGRASYGRRAADGLGVLLSASTYDSEGRDLYYREFDTPDQNHGVARGLDYDRYRNALARIERGAWSAQAAYVEREKGIPTASYGQVFNDARSGTVDRQGFVQLKYKNDETEPLRLLARVYYGYYGYEGNYVFDYPPVTHNRDETVGRWCGLELRAVTTAIARHKLVLGAEYQRDARQDQRNVDLAPRVEYLDDRRDRDRVSLYAADEYGLSPDLLLNAGLRYDRAERDDAPVSPRVALIYRVRPQTTLKSIYGTAFRAPNAYELYYLANPGLYKLVLEHYPDPGTRLVASAFYYDITDLISLTTDPGARLQLRALRAVAAGARAGVPRVRAGG